VHRGLTVLFAFLAVFCIGAVLSADPCDRGDAAGIFGDAAGIFLLLTGLVFAGGAAFGVARAMTERVWVPWTAAVCAPLTLGVGSYVVLLVRWGVACSR